MKHDSLHRSAMRTAMVGAVVAALICLLPAATATAQEQAGLPTELIKVTNVSMDSAYTLADGVCRGAALRKVPMEDGQTGFEPSCIDVSYLEDERMLAVTATPEVVARIRALLAEFDRLPETHAFQIIVLAADRSGSGFGDVPANVAEALQDVRDFLPYTAFSVLGSGWLRTSARGETTLPGPMDLSVELDFRPTTDPTAPLLIERFRVRRYTMVDVVTDGVRTQQIQSRRILETTFTINPGETVVVGTSKLNGDDTAVVVLLTAVRN